MKFNRNEEKRNVNLVKHGLHIKDIKRKMNKRSIIKDSQTDWQRLDNMQDHDINLTDIPEITEEQMSRARLRIDGKPVPMEKVRVNILLDASVAAYFKTQAGGRGFQTLINEALKENIRNHDLENIMRRIIREELKATS